MGKCSICGKKISYNNYKVIKGIVYCLKCKPDKEPVSKKLDDGVSNAKLDFYEIDEEEFTWHPLDPGLPDEEKPKKKRSKKKSTRRKK